jgi:hypothetical protein
MTGAHIRFVRNLNSRGRQVFHKAGVRTNPQKWGALHAPSGKTNLLPLSSIRPKHNILTSTSLSRYGALVLSYAGLRSVRYQRQKHPA